MILAPFELRPSMPPEGMQISALEAGGHSEHVEEHLNKAAERGGFPYSAPPFVPNTHLALSLGEFARDLGAEQHRSAHAAIFKAYFGEGRDIGKRDVLLEVATAVGFDAGEVEEAWDADRYDGRLHRFMHLGLGLGVTSTPAALICNELLIGSRPYEVLKKSVDRCLLTAENIEAESEAELT